MNELQRNIFRINSSLIKRSGVPLKNSRLPNPLDMLIATILSQNTNDKNSYKAFTNLKKKYPTWILVSTASRSAIEDTIRVAGLAPQKSRTIKNILDYLSKNKRNISLEYLSKLNNDDALIELTKFKGVGIKTASCVLLFSLNRNICPVDTHVHRTVNRIGLVNTKSPDKTFLKLNKNFPDNIAHSFHTNLIRLGREICRPQNPKCSLCPLLNLCGFNRKNLYKVSQLKKNSFMLLDNV